MKTSSCIPSVVATIALPTTDPAGLQNAGTVINNLDSGGGSFRSENARAELGDTIRFDAALDDAGVALFSGQLIIDKDLILDASSLD
ncbi:MAG: hypothetical protein ACI9R3_002474 [Verrucomicrobiales bacterium]|jgi:hypothetical protein